jgi:archaellum component FlaC
MKLSTLALGALLLSGTVHAQTSEELKLQAQIDALHEDVLAQKRILSDVISELQDAIKDSQKEIQSIVTGQQQMANGAIESIKALQREVDRLQQEVNILKSSATPASK